MVEEDNLDLVLPTKKKKTKKVDFDEGETLEKEDGKINPNFNPFKGEKLMKAHI